MKSIKSNSVIGRLSLVFVFLILESASFSFEGEAREADITKATARSITLDEGHESIGDPFLDCPPEYTLEWPADFNFEPPPPNQPYHPLIHPEITGSPQLVGTFAQGPPQFQDELFGPDPSQCPALWFIERHWFVMDIEGVVYECVQFIVFLDTTPPEIFGPPDLTIEWPTGFNTEPVPDGLPQDPSVDPEITGIPEVIDNCFVQDISFFDILIGPNPSACPQPWFLERNWIAIDPCGNEAFYTQIITFTDFTPPEIFCPPGDTYEWPSGYNIDEVPEGVPQDPSIDPGQTGIPDVSDNCAVADLTFCDVIIGPSSEDCPDLWRVERTWKAVDACGNSSDCVQVFIYQDTTNPEFPDPPADADYQCPDDVPDLDTLLATDNCSPDWQVTGSEESDGNTCPETIIRTWIAIDACGNSTVAVQTITVDDTIAPEFPNAPADAAYQCSDDVPPLETLLMTDNCDPDLSVIGFEISDGLSCPETITRSWSYTDACGNATTVFQTITVHDTTDPVFENIADATYQCIADVPTLATLLVTDNCEGQTSVIGTESSDGNSCPETITRIWTWADQCGNEASAFQTITVHDTTDPVFANIANANYQCSADVPAQGTLLMTDNCDGQVSVIGTEFSDGNSCPETIFRNWSYTDFCGNTGTALQIITVDDNISPVIHNVPGPINYQCPGDVPAPGMLPWTDNCDGNGNVMGVDVLGTGSCPLLIARSWSYTDACGNNTTSTQMISVNDTSDPDLFCPANDTIEWVADFNLEEVPQGVPQDPSVSPDTTGFPFVIENCTLDGVVFLDTLYGPFPDECPYLWYVERTWVAYDLCDNSGFCIQRITLTDLTAPEVVCPDDVILVSESPDGITYDFSVTATDNCDSDIDILVSQPPDFLYPCDQTTTVTATATDDCGNTSSCNFDITVECSVDDCPGDITGDDVVNITDFLAFNSAFGTSCTGCPEDLNGDGVVGIDDFLVFNSNFGSDCTGLVDDNPSKGVNPMLLQEIQLMGPESIAPALYSSIMKMSSSLDFNIVPNPNDGSRFELSVMGVNGIEEGIWVQIFDMTGRRALSIITGTLDSRMVIQTEEDLSPGLYIVSITVAGNKISKRMVVE